MIGLDLRRRLAAETAGTAILVAAGLGAGVMGARIGADPGAALLAASLVAGAILTVLITVLTPVSGGHINPIITLTFWLSGDLRAPHAAAYVGAQIAGGALGLILCHAMYDLPAIQIASTARSGPAQWLSETVATFCLIATVLLAVRFRPAAVPGLVGLVAVTGFWLTASTGFSNPVVTLARMFSDTPAGIRPADAPGFVAGEIAGALIAFAAIRWLLRPRHG